MKYRLRLVAVIFTSLLIGAFYTEKGYAMTRNNYLDQAVYGEKSIRQLLNLDKSQNIEYAGKYIENGRLNLLLVFSSAKEISQSVLKQRVNDINKIGHIRIFNADFSLDNLTASYNILISNMKELSKDGLVSIELSEKKNRIIVTVKNDKDDILLNKIISLVNKKMLIIRNSSTNISAQF